MSCLFLLISVTNIFSLIHKLNMYKTKPYSIFKHVNGGFRKTDNLEDPNLYADSVTFFCTVVFAALYLEH